MPWPEQEVVSQKEHEAPQEPFTAGAIRPPTLTHSSALVYPLPLEFVYTHCAVRLCVPSQDAEQGDHADNTNAYDVQGCVLQGLVAGGRGPADAQSTAGCELTACVLAFTHCTVREVLPPPQFTEQPDHGDADHVKPPAHACVLQGAVREEGDTVPHLDTATLVPNRSLRHTGERHCKPPPHDTEHVE